MRMPWTRIATARVRRLLAVPQTARDQSWETELAGQLPRASFRRLDRNPIQGSSGFPCLLLSTSDGNGDHQRFEEVLDQALDGGLGIVIRPQPEGAGVEMRFGALATYRMFKAWLTPPGWNGGPADNGQEIVQRVERVEISAPNEHYLPPFIRKALRCHLESAGVRNPRVLLVNWPEREYHRDLAFSIDQSDFPTPEAYEEAMRSLAWFLPEGYQWLSWESVPNWHGAAVAL